jgi:hypothetical protein
MTRCLSLVIVAASIQTLTASSSPKAPGKAEALAKVDYLCSVTGMKRVGGLKSISPPTRDSPETRVKVDLQVDGECHPYTIDFNSLADLSDFVPDFDWPWVDKHMRDARRGELKDDKARALCLSAIKRVNSRFHFPYRGGGTFEYVGDYLVLHYDPFGPEGKKAPPGVWREPTCWFLVSRRGTVCGTSCVVLTMRLSSCVVFSWRGTKPSNQSMKPTPKVFASRLAPLPYKFSVFATAPSTSSRFPASLVRLRSLLVHQ